MKRIRDYLQKHLPVIRVLFLIQILLAVYFSRRLLFYSDGIFSGLGKSQSTLPFLAFAVVLLFFIVQSVLYFRTSGKAKFIPANVCLLIFLVAVVVFRVCSHGFRSLLAMSFDLRSYASRATAYLAIETTASLPFIGCELALGFAGFLQKKEQKNSEPFFRDRMSGVRWLLILHFIFAMCFLREELSSILALIIFFKAWGTFGPPIMLFLTVLVIAFFTQLMVSFATRSRYRFIPANISILPIVIATIYSIVTVWSYNEVSLLGSGSVYLLLYCGFSSPLIGCELALLLSKAIQKIKSRKETGVDA